MKLKLIILSILLFITYNMQAKIWHVSVNGHGFTYNYYYNTAFTASPYCSVIGSAIQSIPMSTTNNCNAGTNDIYNKVAASGTATTNFSIYPCGDWDATNSCWNVGDGTIDHPWSLEFALSNPPDPTKVDGTNYWLLDQQANVQDPITLKWSYKYDIVRWIKPGDVILVHGGTYNGRTILVQEQTLYDYKNSTSTYNAILASGTILNVTSSLVPTNNNCTVLIDAGNPTDALNIVNDKTQIYYFYAMDINGYDNI